MKEKTKPRFIKVLNYFCEHEMHGRILDTSEPFPTHLQYCSSESWEKFLDSVNSYEIVENPKPDEIFSFKPAIPIPISIDKPIVDNYSIY